MRVVIDKGMVEKYMARQGFANVAELATAADLATPSVYRVLKGEGFHSETLASLAAALGVNARLLIEEVEPEVTA